MKKGIFFLAVLLILSFSIPALAEEEAVHISTPEALAAIADAPGASYVLDCDIDMAGVRWIPFGFSGKLNGQGHTILNLTVVQPGEETRDTYDGNMKVYETYFAGLFSTLENAKVENLNLLNIRVLVETDLPCFVGAVAGYMDKSSVSGVQINGELELRAHERQFGVAGIIGFGNGIIENTGTDVTLICVDTDASTRDEQFLGGAYGAGYIDLDGVEINIAGYISEHGYVHSGGAVGMYALYPKGTGYDGKIRNTHITGKITFFEDNTNRRAYCKDLVGETLNWTYSVSGNWSKFTRDERYDYTVELRPEMCENPVIAEETVLPDGLEFGYTEYRCTLCGNTYRDNYTIHDHVAENWTLTKQPTVEDFGESEASCDICGKHLSRQEPKLDPPPTEPPTEPATEPTVKPTVPITTKPVDKTPNLSVPIALLAVLVLALIICLLLLRRNNLRRKRSHKTRKR